MPTQEKWINNHTIQTTWDKHMSVDDLSQCFENLAKAVHQADGVIHVLFDISNVQRIPSQAPILFIRSTITSAPNLGRLAVIGVNPLAQILAQIAVKMTTHQIRFFPSKSEALTYIGVTNFAQESLIKTHQGYS